MNKGILKYRVVQWILVFIIMACMNYLDIKAGRDATPLFVIAAIFFSIGVLLFLNPEDYLVKEIRTLIDLLVDEDVFYHKETLDKGYEFELGYNSYGRCRTVELYKNGEFIYSGSKGINKLFTDDTIVKLIPEVKELQKQAKRKNKLKLERKLKVNERLWKENK